MQSTSDNAQANIGLMSESDRIIVDLQLPIECDSIELDGPEVVLATHERNVRWPRELRTGPGSCDPGLL